MASKNEPALRQRRVSSPPTGVRARAQSAEPKRASPPRLLAWHELDAWRRDNAFLVSGYRPTSRSWRGCLASLARLHNESVNIWTHLLGAALVAALGAAAAGGCCGCCGCLGPRVAPRAAATAADALVFGCFFAGALLCLGMSAAFHALSNHSPGVAKWANKLDYTGIVCLVLGSFMPAMYYGLYCLPALMEMYIAGIWALGLGCVAVSWADKFRTPAWRPYRAAMFVGLGVSGVVPVVHAITIFGFQELDERMGLKWVVAQGVLYIVGAFIYAIRWPERLAPRTFDIWGSSHQIFHVFILLAAATHLVGMLKAFDFHHGTLGPRCSSGKTLQ